MKINNLLIIVISSYLFASTNQTGSSSKQLFEAIKRDFGANKAKLSLFKASQIENTNTNELNSLFGATNFNERHTKIGPESKQPLDLIPPELKPLKTITIDLNKVSKPIKASLVQKRVKHHKSKKETKEIKALKHEIENILTKNKALTSQVHSLISVPKKFERLLSKTNTKIKRDEQVIQNLNNKLNQVSKTAHESQSIKKYLSEDAKNLDKIKADIKSLETDTRQAFKTEDDEFKNLKQEVESNNILTQTRIDSNNSQVINLIKRNRKDLNNYERTTDDTLRRNRLRDDQIIDGLREIRQETAQIVNTGFR